MKIGAIVPHLLCFGGVRRFLELGEAFNRIDDIEYTVFSEKGQDVDWMDYSGTIENWSWINADYLLIGDPPSFRILGEVEGEVFIWVIAGGGIFAPVQKDDR